MKKELPEKYLNIQPTILEVEDANRLVVGSLCWFYPNCGTEVV